MNDTTPPKIVFDSQYPFFGIFILIMLPLVSICGFAFLYTKFSDRPVIVVIMAVIALLFILSASAEKILVGTDRFTIVTIGVLPILRRRKTFLYSAVASIEASLPLTQGGDISQNEMNALRSPWLGTYPTKNNKLTIRYKDGVEVELTPSIYRGAFHKALEHIGRLSDISIKIEDK